MQACEDGRRPVRLFVACRSILAATVPVLALAVSLSSCGSPLQVQESSPGSTRLETPRVGDLPSVELPSESPYAGTVWISPDVLTPESTSDLISVRDTGTASYTLYDDRQGADVLATFSTFEATFACAPTSMTVLVEDGIGNGPPLKHASFVARILGQMPLGLRLGVRQVVIRQGDLPASAGYGTVNFYVDFLGSEWPFVEEVFLHELAHTTLDPYPGGAALVNAGAWQDAQNADGSVISDYARESPAEDLAESYGAFSVLEASMRNDSLLVEGDRVKRTIPNRLAVLADLGPDFSPRELSCPSMSPRLLTGMASTTTGDFTTITWTPPEASDGIIDYEWRVGSRPDDMTEWTSFGNASTSQLEVENYGRGNTWLMEVRATWGDGPGPSSVHEFVS